MTSEIPKVDKKTDDFWKGYVEAIEAMNVRLDFYLLNLKDITRFKPYDLLMDIKSELTDLSEIHLTDLNLDTP